MKKFLLCLLVSGFCCCIACSNNPEKGASVEVIDGIEYIHNFETPLFPHRTVTFEEELVIRSEDEEGNILLYRPGWYLVDSKGYVYICDLQDLEIKVFDPDGYLVQTVGQKGDGPGEFQNIGEIALLPDDRLLVLDWEAHEVAHEAVVNCRPNLAPQMGCDKAVAVRLAHPKGKKCRLN